MAPSTLNVGLAPSINPFRKHSHKHTVFTDSKYQVDDNEDYPFLQAGHLYVWCGSFCFGINLKD